MVISFPGIILNGLLYDSVPGVYPVLFTKLPPYCLLANISLAYPIKDTVNKTGFFSLGNIGKYKDLYKYIKTETGLTSEDAKGILNKAVENESWLKRNSIKAAINPFYIEVILKIHL